MERNLEGCVREGFSFAPAEPIMRRDEVWRPGFSSVLNPSIFLPGLKSSFPREYKPESETAGVSSVLWDASSLVED
jgi:hypothetical protein